MYSHFAAYTIVGAALAILTPQAEAALHAKTHEGIVVSTAENQLVMTDKDGKNEHTHMIDASVKVTLNGSPAKVTDLVAGDLLRVAVSSGNKVMSVAAMRAAP